MSFKELKSKTIRGIKFDFANLHPNRPKDPLIATNVPIGNSPKQRAVLDKLVYQNSKLVWGKNRQQIIRRLDKFLKVNMR